MSAPDNDRAARRAERAGRGARERASARFGRDRIMRTGSGPMVVFDRVTKTYPGGTVGLEDLSVTIDAGEFVFLVGPSGSGKSTFIRTMMKELEFDAGRIVVGGRDLGALRRNKVPHLRRSIGCVFQDFKLLTNRTASENVAYALQVIGEPPRQIRRKVQEMLALVGLAEKGGRLPTELSGGEQQRVSIARAFVNHPSLLIADEPTGNLDPETSIGIMQLLHRINRTGTTVIVATHDREMVDRMQMRVIALEGGRLVRDQREGNYEHPENFGLTQTGSAPVVAPQADLPAGPPPPAAPPLGPDPAATSEQPLAVPPPGMPTWTPGPDSPPPLPPRPNVDQERGR